MQFLMNYPITLVKPNVRFLNQGLLLIADDIQREKIIITATLLFFCIDRLRPKDCGKQRLPNLF